MTRNELDELMRKHLPLVDWVMRARFAYAIANHADDLRQEGLMGLMRATETFDPARGVKFSTYATYWIRARMGRYMTGQHRHSRPTSPFGDAIPGEDGRAHWPRASKISLDAPVAGLEDMGTYRDTLADESLEPVDDQIDAELTHQRMTAAVMEAVRELGDPRLAVVARERLLSPADKTLAQVASIFGHSREWTRLAELRILRATREILARTA